MCLCCVIFLVRWFLTERFFSFESAHIVSSHFCFCVTPSFIMLFPLKVEARYQECSSGLKKTQTQTSTLIMWGLLTNTPGSLSSWSPWTFTQQTSCAERHRSSWLITHSGFKFTIVLIRVRARVRKGKWCYIVWCTGSFKRGCFTWENKPLHLSCRLSWQSHTILPLP